MTTQQVNTRLPDHSIRQLTQLAKKTGMTQTQIIIIALDRLYQQEIKVDGKIEERNE